MTDEKKQIAIARRTPIQRKQKSVKATRTPVPAPDAAPAPDGSTFPVVGIGASAGGLEAFGHFFENTPKCPGLAFVVVQHMDPTQKGILVELLQRKTAMPVVQIKDRMKVEPNHVYVIPPNKDLSLLHGVLHLLAPAQPRGLRLPIDFFFRSLAADLGEKAIGVLLSGMGSDGTLGLQAIKEKAGAIFVQEPTSAKFDGMPRSAIKAGLVDVVARADELPGKILAYLHHVPLRVRPDGELEEKDQSALEKIVILLRIQTGNDFSLYKKNTVYRRIERRMGLHQISRIADYVRYLRENSREVELLFKELLIGVTSFFRDPEVWVRLKEEVIPALLAAHPNGGVLRAWTPGCSTGEEAYSLAMVFKEAVEKINPAKKFSLQIFATDLDKDAIEKARAGVYPASIAADVPEERLTRFFRMEERVYRVNKEIREMVIFAVQNVITDPPFTKMNILTCRNLLIYLAPELQKKLMALFHYSLNPDGNLVLGTAETIGAATSLFAPMGGKTRLYRRRHSQTRLEPTEFPPAFARSRAGALETLLLESDTAPSPPNIQALADQLLLQQYSPAAVLGTEKGDIVYINGKTGKYLEPAAGRANWNLFAMARDGLSSALNVAFRKAVRNKEPVTLKNLAVAGEGGTRWVDVVVQPVAEPVSLRGTVMVVFTDVAPPPATKPPGKRGRAAVRDEPMEAQALELQQSREDLQTTREEMQTSQEELKSTNEELQSTNEELQSTNEELTTSKEEMQSMNEELQTVNQELQAKVDDLMRASNDMQNLLNSTDIATLFLDAKLNVRRFTPKMTNIIKLIPGDAGRPVTDIVSRLDYPRLADDAREVMKTLTFTEKQITGGDGRWFTVRIMPYRTHDDHIDGLVITFSDITVSKKLETQLRATEAKLRAPLASSRAKGKR